MMRSIRRKLLSGLCAAALVVSCLPAVPAAARESDGITLRQSGSTSLPKLSKEEITQLVQDAPSRLSYSPLEEEPSINAPYTTGSVKQEALQAATDRLNLLRRLAGLPAVQLDADLSRNAQYGAVLLAHMDQLSHTPSQPSDMDDAFYDQAYEATSTSNLAAGISLVLAPDELMNDSDMKNRSSLGHRRWQLNPALGKVGFGYAENPDGRFGKFVVEKVFDKSGSCPDYDFISWPASGNFPSDTPSFDNESVWSVTLNPDRYQFPERMDLNITITRQSDGKTWVINDSTVHDAAQTGMYLNVSSQAYGVPNCIIFRPGSINFYRGVYQVTIDGLRDIDGDPVDFTYQVDFFSTSGEEPEGPESPEDPTSPVDPFQPVGASDWAVPFIQEAFQLNVLPVELQSRYTATATRSEICALTVSLYEAVTGAPVAGRTDFTDTDDPYVEKAAFLGIVNGVGNGAFRPDDPLTREQAAVMLDRLARILNCPLPQEAADFSDRNQISSWALSAVGAVQCTGIMNGVGSGRFDPSGLYSREQCISTLMRLYHWYQALS